jgi:hypothetical protein
MKADSYCGTSVIVVMKCCEPDETHFETRVYHVTKLPYPTGMRLQTAAHSICNLETRPEHPPLSLSPQNNNAAHNV